MTKIIRQNNNATIDGKKTNYIEVKIGKSTCCRFSYYIFFWKVDRLYKTIDCSWSEIITNIALTNYLSGNKDNLSIFSTLPDLKRKTQRPLVITNPNKQINLQLIQIVHADHKPNKHFRHLRKLFWQCNKIFTFTKKFSKLFFCSLNN